MSLVVQEVEKVVKGKREVIVKSLAAVLAGGNILLEDIPGVGKTTFALTLARSLSLDYKRVQFTPDVLPSDITGFSMYNAGTHEFEFREGAAFCNLFLADEINRTSPKTQSALLELMEERKVTVDGVTRALPSPFIVMATENPIGSSGTQMLPESQLDRFMICLSMGYPSHDSAIEILKSHENRPINHVQQILSKEDLVGLQEKANSLPVHDSIYDYIVSLVEETRSGEFFSLGVSPRGGIALLQMARAVAVINGRDYVAPEDIEYIFTDVLSHRVRLSTKAKAAGYTAAKALTEVWQSVPVPRT